MAIETFENDSVTIKVDNALCKGHGDCAENCPGEVYNIEGGKAVAARLDGCVACCTCAAVCPEGAIEHSSCG